MSFYESKLRKPVVGNQRIGFQKRKGTILNAHAKKILNYLNVLYIRRLLRLVVLHLDEDLRVQGIPALDLYLQISFPYHVLLRLFVSFAIQRCLAAFFYDHHIIASLS